MFNESIQGLTTGKSSNDVATVRDDDLESLTPAECLSKLEWKRFGSAPASGREVSRVLTIKEPEREVSP